MSCSTASTASTTWRRRAPSSSPGASPSSTATGCATFLARDGGEDVGIAVLRFRPSLWDDADEAYLAELFVLPDRRKRGLGAELMAAVLGLARERGCRFIELGTDEHDHDAHRLYERSGFTNFANPDAPEAERERMLFFEREL